MNYCLITGAAGFIGSHISNELIKKNIKVIAFDDLSSGYIENIPKEAVFIKGSVNDKILLEKIFSEYKIDYIFHLAAYATDVLSHYIKHFNYTNNLIGSINLINFAVNYSIKCFVFTSSIAVYGHQTPPFTENTIPKPDSSYGIAKFSIEQELKITKDMFDLNYIIFRPHNVYGEKQNIGDTYRNVIGIFMNQILRKKPLTIFGDGEQIRPFTYIKDISDIIACSIFNKKCYNNIFNLGSDTPFTINEIAKKICNIFEINPNIKYCNERKEIKYSCCSHEKQKIFFSDIKNTPIDEGLKRMAKWAKKRGLIKNKNFNDIEITKNLPDIWKK